MVLSKHVDGVIVVVGRATSKQIVRRTCARISDSGAKLLGVVLNQVSASHDSYYPYNSYNGYNRDYYTSNGASTGKPQPRRISGATDDQSFVILG